MVGDLCLVDASEGVWVRQLVEHVDVPGFLLVRMASNASKPVHLVGNLVKALHKTFRVAFIVVVFSFEEWVRLPAWARLNAVQRHWKLGVVPTVSGGNPNLTGNCFTTRNCFHSLLVQIGRASCRERVCQYV